ncbi:hypothetical protein, partial [Campylobacter sp. CS_NA1]|uniref:hypothetical protein n=1 Tax=Campylobacter sp. CS_NA1 TaxID=2984139 RepID=UPI0022E9AF41
SPKLKQPKCKFAKFKEFKNSKKQPNFINFEKNHTVNLTIGDCSASLRFARNDGLCRRYAHFASFVSLVLQ